MKGWEEKLHPHAIKPIQQFEYIKGKNATDASMPKRSVVNLSHKIQ